MRPKKALMMLVRVVSPDVASAGLGSGCGAGFVSGCTCGAGCWGAVCAGAGRAGCGTGSERTGRVGCTVCILFCFSTLGSTSGMRRGSGTEAGRRAGAAGPGLFFLAARILGRSPSRSSSTAVENRSSVLKLLPLPSVISGRSSFWMGPNAEPPPEDSSMLPWPRLCRMASTWRSVTLSRMPRSACSWLSSSRMRSTESFVRLLGMLFSPLVWDSFFCAAVTCGAA